VYRISRCPQQTKFCPKLLSSLKRPSRCAMGGSLHCSHAKPCVSSQGIQHYYSFCTISYDMNELKDIPVTTLFRKQVLRICLRNYVVIITSCGSDARQPAGTVGSWKYSKYAGIYMAFALKHMIVTPACYLLFTKTLKPPKCFSRNYTLRTFNKYNFIYQQNVPKVSHKIRN
jgi:hypothetical protein